jgi:transcription antitermination factor NusA-like protein
MLRVSRASPALATALLFAEVPAIAEGHVSVSGLARKAGHVTKVALFADAPLTPDGLPPRVAVMGPDGSYIGAVRAALGGEPLHVVTHAVDDLEATVAAALWPARIGAVVVGGVPPAGSKLEASRVAVIAYALGDDDVAMAVGRGGHNVACAGALACTLTGQSLRLFVRPWTEAVEADIPLRFKDKSSVNWGDARAVRKGAWGSGGDDASSSRGGGGGFGGGVSGGFKPPMRRGAAAPPEGGGYMSRTASSGGADRRSSSRGGDERGGGAAGGFGARTWGSRSEAGGRRGGAGDDDGADADDTASALAALDAMRFADDVDERAADAAAAAAAAAAADVGTAGAEQLSWGGYAPPSPPPRARKSSSRDVPAAPKPKPRKPKAAADADADGGFAAWEQDERASRTSGDAAGGGFIAADDGDAGLWAAIPPRPAGGASAPGAGAARWAAEFDDAPGGGGDDDMGAWADLPADDE